VTLTDAKNPQKNEDDIYLEEDGLNSIGGGRMMKP
jgi:hypothetical protein